jgi:hypothetical protein
MMDGASPETYWASYKYGIIKKFDTLLHLVGSSFMNNLIIYLETSFMSIC